VLLAGTYVLLVRNGDIHWEILFSLSVQCMVQQSNYDSSRQTGIAPCIANLYNTSPKLYERFSEGEEYDVNPIIFVLTAIVL
jgi:hypothetical protein